MEHNIYKYDYVMHILIYIFSLYYLTKMTIKNRQDEILLKVVLNTITLKKRNILYRASLYI